jgi:plasmid stabilization system protein ParE
MRRVVWSDRATASPEAIKAYLAQSNPLAAQRLGLKLIGAAQSLDHLAERGRPVGQGRRELLSLKPYIIRYEVYDDEVLIVDVRHGARRPQR